MRPLSEQSHYEVLEVEPGAAPDVVRAGYERLRKLLGPGSLAVYSLVEPAEQQALLLRMDEAFAVLSDPAQRRRYDASLGIAPQPEAPARSSFTDALRAIRAAGSGADDADAPQAVAAPALQDDLAEIVLDDADLLEVVEIAGALVAEPRDTLPVDEAAILEEEPLDPDAIGAEAIEAACGEPERLPESGPFAQAIAAAEAPPAATPPVLRAIDGATRFTGALLREVREARGLSLDEIARRTRIQAVHFANLEEERWADLPERVFLQGYLTAFARELRLDPTQVVATYLARRDSVRTR
ncbi:helix-turn-helix domain-containing protein [Vulgatibacter sp.]|uniref:helix-turn-helix domain-containing protein n=1 Tax=Vulgatibacter sp. TaxID=1971226 RepID=UPI003563A07C